MTKGFAVSVSLNDTSRIIPKNSGFFVWNDLTPGTLYTFEFAFYQLHLEFINVSQSLEVQAETGIHCFVGVTINVRKCCLLLRRIRSKLQRICIALCNFLLDVYCFISGKNETMLMSQMFFFLVQEQEFEFVCANILN